LNETLLFNFFICFQEWTVSDLQCKIVPVACHTLADESAACIPRHIP